MNIYLISAITLVLLLIFTSFAGKRGNKNTSATGTDGYATLQQEKTVSGSCCGKHAVCEKQKLAEAMMKDADYYDDEDLDIFKGRNSSEYEDQEIEEFRYVLYTMQQNEVSDWLDSLKVREIEFPDSLKEEAIALMSETD